MCRPQPDVAASGSVGTTTRGKSRAEWIAAYVETPKSARLSDADQRRLDDTLRLAADLGAKTITLSGANVADEVIAYALNHNVTKIVIGKPIRSRWRDVLFGSAVDDLVRRSGDIDIYVIRGDSDEPEPRMSLKSPDRPPDTKGLILAATIMAITTALGWLLYHRFGIANENVLMLYLLGVVWVATHSSRGAAILASVLAVAMLDLILVPPYYTFAVSDRQYVVTFLVMLLTALVISTLTHRVRVQAAGRGTNTLPAAEGMYVPLRASRGAIGVLGLLASSNGGWSPDQTQLAEAFASQTALAVERTALAEEARAAWERVEAEFLRNTLLSGVSHEFRTPLASITGASLGNVISDLAATDSFVFRKINRWHLKLRVA